MKKNIFKFLLSIFVLIVVVVSVNAQSDQILDNAEVINLVNSGLPQSIIIKKIQDSPNRFDLSTDGLVELSKKGVPEEVITAMMEASDKTVSESYEVLTVFEEPGIYLYKGNDLKSENLVHMQPSVIDRIKEGSVGNTMARSMTAAAKTKVKAYVTSSNSNFTVPGNRPEFYFYFGNTEAEEAGKKQDYDPNDPVAMMQVMQQMTQGGPRKNLSDIQSPNEINLVKCEESKKERMFVASKSSGMAMESGIDPHYVVPFRYEKVAKGLFRVYFDQPLEIGEYLFVYAGAAIYQGQFVFDFSVR